MDTGRTKQKSTNFLVLSLAFEVLLRVSQLQIEH